MSAVHHINVTIRNKPLQHFPGFSDVLSSDLREEAARSLFMYTIEIHIQTMTFKFERNHSKAKVYRNASVHSRVSA